MLDRPELGPATSEVEIMTALALTMGFQGRHGKIRSNGGRVRPSGDGDVGGGASLLGFIDLAIQVLFTQLGSTPFGYMPKSGQEVINMKSRVMRSISAAIIQMLGSIVAKFVSGFPTA